ncbi:MAG: hypothetical protein OHK93_001611 [Ramalina farinacea]|uniref:Major facilitator superfamily (MFS) profile domain-containing protein n=1 Tax=Ramalina farinacea TaxID=258253 RepID=A0AA43QPV0_9LECA|nr:hypothetical protein [Ramalina farinacea]
MKQYLGLRGRKLEFAIIYGVVMPGFLLFGYNNSIAGGLVELESWVDTFPIINGERGGNAATLQGLAISLYVLGLAISCLMCIYIGPRIGRIRTILLGTGTFFIGAVIQSASYSFGQLIVGRLVAGLCLGMATCTYAVYQQETSTGAAYKRGSLAAIEGVFNTAGLALANWVSLGFSFTKGSISWRFPLALPIVLALYICLFCLFLRESPKWLMYKGREPEARRVMSALTDASPTAPEVEKALSDIQASLDKTKGTHFKDLLQRDGNRLLHRTMIAAAVMFFQQWTGINAVASYNAALFAQIGLDPLLARILAGAAFTWFTITSVTPYFLVERVGRRKLLLASSIGMSVCMAVLAGVISVPDNRSALIVGALFLFLFLTFMGVGFYGIPFFYAAEIAPHAYRSQITAIAYNFLWTYAFVMAEITPIALTNISYRYFIVFAACNAAIAIAVYLFFPETMSLSLEQIDQIFVETTGYFDCVKVAERIRKRAVQAGRDGHVNNALEAVEADEVDAEEWKKE